MKIGKALRGALFALAAAACARETPPKEEKPAPAPAAVAPAPPPAPVAITPPTSAAGQAINAAVFAEALQDPLARRDMLIRAQVLLDRAHFSPGVIDGKEGGNFSNALMAYEAARKLPVDGKLDADVWAALAEDARPAAMDYVIAPDDVKGPFPAAIPTDYAEMAKLDHLGYLSPAEALAERFHMDEALLRALNPGADFATAGATIIVTAATGEPLTAKVAAIEVDKAKRQLRAYGDDGALIAVYPATVGSTERPAPSGEWAVRTLAPNPTYTFDPKRLTFGDKGQGKLTIAAGPNNPVGSTWIDLTKDTYGIHGAPDPRLVGKVASHGCVRLTNWDAAQLGAAVRKGTKVKFMGTEA
jgi:lipoprotein-anchoring transpeptidase ErfK/SrfK